MRFVIVGPGALGTIFAAALARAGHDVRLLGRSSATFAAIRASGMHLQSRNGVTEQLPVPITDDPAVVADTDAVIVLVKATDTQAAMTRIRPYIAPGTLVLTLQNGLGNAAVIRHTLGTGPRILPGITSQAGLRADVAQVIHSGSGPTIIGYDSERDASAAAQIADALSNAGLPAATVPDIDRWIWHKVAVNAAINGLTALASVPNGNVARDPELLDAAETIAEEAAAVARTHGIELGGMRNAVLETATASAENWSSMLQDLEAGRPPEVEAIHGAIQREAARAGIITPAIDVIAAIIRAKVKAERLKETVGAKVR